MKLERIHHVAIICSDYQESKRFYVEILGLPIIRETYRSERESYKLDLAIGEGQLELFSFPDPPQRISQPEACGLRHLALQVENVQLTVRELKERGVMAEPIRYDEYTGKKFTFFRDPDGLPLELYER